MKRFSKCFSVFMSLFVAGIFGACQGKTGEQGIQGIQGIQGEKGADGITPTVEISEDGYWVINGIRTDTKAVGQDGKDGKNGRDGKDGNNGSDGSKGDSGADGRGIVSVAYDDKGNLVLTYTDKTTQTLVLPKKEEPVHRFTEWKTFNAEVNNCAKKLFWRNCIDCGFVEWKPGSEADHVAETSYSYNAYSHWFACKNCLEHIESENHVLDENNNCTVCKQHIGGVHYKISDDGTYGVVTGYDGLANIVMVASEYQGVPVTEIGAYAFCNTKTIDIVQLPNSISIIGEGAFLRSGVGYLDLPDSVITIEEAAFQDCSYIFDFNIPASVKRIGPHAFQGAGNMRLTVDENNKDYKMMDRNLYSKDGSTMYWYNSWNYEKTFSIPDTVQTIAEGAFFDCKFLEELTIPSSVSKIERWAFDCFNPPMKKINFIQTEGWKYVGEDGSDAKEIPPYSFRDSALQTLQTLNGYELVRV